MTVFLPRTNLIKGHKCIKIKRERFRILKGFKEINVLLANDTFNTLLNCDTIKITQLNAIIALLIKLGIPFDLEYSPGTRRLAAAAELTIYINPSTTLNFTLNFEAGDSISGGIT
ncbi:hypothetical protein [Desulforamulus putei]|uniref:Uncharacterized protein n=1 Tax=Desulforamulus putei DSM 12395 TaxID=1121429 RepID=A0A1M5C3Q8_9FIRM|nr:hypothetical protein [Desulforamulus putei]SHF49072.1 hypothetical protein SAMN02745133_02787 [Desulforamulus putei DSM 12395]